MYNSNTDSLGLISDVEVFFLWVTVQEHCEVYLSPKKERSIRKYGKSPNEVSFFERSITGHPVIAQNLIHISTLQ